MAFAPKLLHNYGICFFSGCDFFKAIYYLSQIFLRVEVKNLPSALATVLCILSGHHYSGLCVTSDSKELIIIRNPFAYRFQIEILQVLGQKWDLKGFLILINPECSFLCQAFHLIQKGIGNQHLELCRKKAKMYSIVGRMSVYIPNDSFLFGALILLAHSISLYFYKLQQTRSLSCRKKFQNSHLKNRIFTLEFHTFHEILWSDNLKANEAKSQVLKEEIKQRYKLEGGFLFACIHDNNVSHATILFVAYPVSQSLNYSFNQLRTLNDSTIILSITNILL
ncbi:hypothetical protein EGR_10445 [Echinococcus granulosus]|uniref:Uncharacterized protein n=1 Tax=Echinococcus granulosus TaxID=6210 RepID=W6U0R1_ECHGR|nr:hypothetical protein EGR_10445 [Echinococcus granulosus]EUB54705.1 hypothetical protein EGR_10445 [Echinococcus granulosus]